MSLCLYQNLSAYQTDLIVGTGCLCAGLMSLCLYQNLSAYQTDLILSTGCLCTGSMAGNFSDRSATVTGRIGALIVIYVDALCSQTVHNLLCNVLVAAHQSICDVYVEHVVEYRGVSKRMDGAEICQQIQYVVCLDRATLNYNLGVQGCVDQIVKLVALFNDCVDQIGYGNADGVYVCDTVDCALNVCIADLNQVSDQKLCLCYICGNLEVHNKVNCLVVLTHNGVYVLIGGNLDLVYAHSGKLCDSSLCLIGQLEALEAKLCQNLCQSEGYLLGYDLIIDIEAVVVAKQGNGCVGIYLVDSHNQLGVCLVVCDELVYGRLCCENSKISNRDLKSEYGVLAKNCLQFLYIDFNQVIGIFCNQLSCCCCNVDGNGNVGLGNIVLNQSGAELSLGSLNVSGIFCAYQSLPIDGNCFLALYHCQILACLCIDDTHNGVVNVNAQLFHKICVVGFHLSIHCCDELHSILYVDVCYAQKLICGKGDYAIGIVTNGDQSCSCQILGSQLLSGNLLVLILGQVQRCSYQVCITLLTVYNCQIEGVVGDLHLTLSDVIDIIANLVNDILNGVVHVDNDAINGSNLLNQVIVDLTENGFNRQLSSRNDLIDHNCFQRQVYHLIDVFAGLLCKDLQIVQVDVQIILQSHNGLDQIVKSLGVAVYKRCLDLLQRCDNCCQLGSNISLALGSNLSVAQINRLDGGDSSIDRIDRDIDITVCNGICICLRVVLRSVCLQIINGIEQSIFDDLLADDAVFLKGLIDDLNDIELIHGSHAGSIKENVIDILRHLLQRGFVHICAGGQLIVQIGKNVICLSIGQITGILQILLDCLDNIHVGNLRNRDYATHIGLTQSLGNLLQDSQLILGGNIGIQKDRFNDLGGNVSNYLVGNGLILDNNLEDHIENAQNLIVGKQIFLGQTKIQILKGLQLGSSRQNIIVLKYLIHGLNDFQLNCGSHFNSCSSAQTEHADCGLNSKNIEINISGKSADLSIGNDTIQKCLKYINDNAQSLIIGHVGIKCSIELFKNNNLRICIQCTGILDHVVKLVQVIQLLFGGQIFIFQSSIQLCNDSISFSIVALTIQGIQHLSVHILMTCSTCVNRFTITHENACIILLKGGILNSFVEEGLG